jgi:hypothetical protein
LFRLSAEWRISSWPTTHCVEVKTIRRHLRHENDRRIDNFAIKNEDLIKTCENGPMDPTLFWFLNPKPFPKLKGDRDFVIRSYERYISTLDVKAPERVPLNHTDGWRMVNTWISMMWMLTPVHYYGVACSI